MTAINSYNVHPERLGALDHRVVKAEYDPRAQTVGNGQVQRVARPQLQCGVTSQLSGTAKFLTSRRGNDAMLAREFMHPLRGLSRRIYRHLAGANLDCGSRSKLDQRSFADRQSLARRLDPDDDSARTKALVSM
jgi:hypothetical protein